MTDVTFHRSRLAPGLRAARLLFWLLLPLVAALAAACDGGQGSSGSPTPAATAVVSDGRYENVPEGRPKYLDVKVPDPPEVLETKPAGQLPDFLSKLSGETRDKVAASYQGAVEHHDEFEHIPCYCGCAVYETPHSSLATCYIHEIKENGDIVFTDHSLTCDKCQQGAEMTLAGIAAGRSLSDVRAEIFKALGYTGIWTDTPAP